MAMGAEANPTCLALVADGSEETEFVSVVDTLVRGGVEVTVASCSSDKTVTCSRGIQIAASVLISDVSGAFDAIFIPGGVGGANAICENKDAQRLLKEQKEKGRWICAICAAPALTLVPLGLLEGPATSYPAPKFRTALPDKSKADEVVVVDHEHKTATSQGPGTALFFGVEILKFLVGADVAAKVAKGLLLA